MNEESRGYLEYEAEREYWEEKFAADVIAGRTVLIEPNDMQMVSKLPKF